MTETKKYIAKSHTVRLPLILQLNTTAVLLHKLLNFTSKFFTLMFVSVIISTSTKNNKGS